MRRPARTRPGARRPQSACTARTSRPAGAPGPAHTSGPLPGCAPWLSCPCRADRRTGTRGSCGPPARRSRASRPRAAGLLPGQTSADGTSCTEIPLRLPRAATPRPGYAAETPHRGPCCLGHKYSGRGARDASRSRRTRRCTDVGCASRLPRFRAKTAAVLLRLTTSEVLILQLSLCIIVILPVELLFGCSSRNTAYIIRLV